MIKRYTNEKAHNTTSTAQQTIQNEWPEPGSVRMHSDPQELGESKFWSWNMAYENYEI